MTTRKRLAASDAAWLHMDRPDNPMVITGLFELSGALPIDEARRVLAQRLLRYDRFAMRVHDVDSGHPWWQHDPDFAIEHHVVAQDGAGDAEAIHRVVDAIASTPLPMDRPLWQIHVLARPGGRTLLLCRIHHCIADGMALMRVLLSIADEHEPQAASAHGAAPRGGDRWARRLAAARTVLRRPLRLARTTLGYAEVAARLVLRPPDPRTRLRGALGASKRTAWSRPLSLATVKRIGRSQDATVNDVLVSAVAGALRHYLAGRSERVRTVRAMVPVDLRALDGPVRLGNRFGLVMLPLPLHHRDPLARLRETKRRMDRLKGEREAVIAFVFLQALGHLSRRMESPFVRFFADKASTVLTNVPGPRRRLHLAGREIRRMMFWVPQTGAMALGISVLSYAGEVFVGVMSDEAVVADPAEIVDAFERELAQLEAATSSETEPAQTEPT